MWTSSTLIPRSSCRIPHKILVLEKRSTGNLQDLTNWSTWNVQNFNSHKIVQQLCDRTTDTNNWTAGPIWFKRDQTRYCLSFKYWYERGRNPKFLSTHSLFQATHKAPWRVAHKHSLSLGITNTDLTKHIERIDWVEYYNIVHHLS